jgi:hypothetical protein
MFYGVIPTSLVNIIKNQSQNWKLYFDESIEDGDIKEDTITTSAGKSITFMGNGVVVIFVPKSLGALTAIRDIDGLNCLSNYSPYVEVTIDGIGYYLYSGGVSAPWTGLELKLEY